MTIALTKRRFTVDEYHRMAQAGILSEDDHVELIQGEVVEMTPIGRRHAGCVGRLTQLFTFRLGDRAIVWVKNPVPISADSELQPDLALLRPSPDFYVETPLGPQEVLLVVEVAETSAPSDRTVKVPLYAEAGIREVWLVDLAAGRVEVYRGPASGGYRERLELVRGQRVAPEAFPAVILTTDAILG